MEITSLLSQILAYVTIIGLGLLSAATAMTFFYGAYLVWRGDDNEYKELGQRKIGMFGKLGKGSPLIPNDPYVAKGMVKKKSKDGKWEYAEVHRLSDYAIRQSMAKE